MTKSLGSDSRLRFAPSPTGTLHVGGARTALFNWLLARGCGGQFILRVEDTDRERSTDESTQAILDGLTWLGLDWDGEVTYQSRRGDRYAEAMDKLVAAGRAYPCFCTKERLDEARAKAQAEKRTFTYDGLCRRLDAEEVARRVEAGEPHTLRFHVEPGSVTQFDDIVGGARNFENDLFGDFVIRRSDGSPIYHMTVVVDDHEMGITHVIRGDDHLSNTPRQMQLFEALGWTPPDYGHVPLIKGADGSRLSKRHGATSVMAYAEQGFLPEAMFNFLSLLGWSLDGETTVISREELVKNFSMDRFSRSAAVFDIQKLEWLNGVYMRDTPIEKVSGLVRESFLRAGVAEDRMPEPWFTAIVGLGVERAKTIEQLRESLDYFVQPRIEEYEAKAARKRFMKEGALEILADLGESLGKIEPFDQETLEPCLKALAESRETSFGNIVHPLRLALTGRSASPGIYDVITGLGRERTLERIEAARGWIENAHAAALAEDAS